MCTHACNQVTTHTSAPLKESLTVFFSLSTFMRWYSISSPHSSLSHSLFFSALYYPARDEESE